MSGAWPSCGSGSSFRPWCAVRLWRVRDGLAKTADDPEHESTGEPLWTQNPPTLGSTGPTPSRYHLQIGLMGGIGPASRCFSRGDGYSMDITPEQVLFCRKIQVLLAKTDAWLRS